ncbi:MAG: glycosyltransferase [Chloroflexota bacterium]
MHSASRAPFVSVIIPVHNGARTLGACLQALKQTVYETWELIVVDDGSDDGSGDMATAQDCRVLTNEGAARGPAWARNHGARRAKGDILVFLDADVAVRRDTVARLVQTLQRTRAAACFGSYDDAPAAKNFLSQYKNLLHHFVHQTGRREANTFWAGCGAVRRDAFWDAGGFHQAYKRPSIEDIELGQRLRARGYSIVLAPEIQVTHLKRWDAPGLLRSDILHRALPWSRLLLRRRELPDDLNLAWRQRGGAVAAWTLLIALVCLPLTRRAGPLAGLSLAALLALNADFYRFLARRRGLGFLARALPWHWFYFIYSSGAFGLALLGEALPAPVPRRLSRS